MSVKEKIESLRASLPAGVGLVAVSKTHPAEAIAEAYAAGQRMFGESRPIELRDKHDSLPDDIEWHMIGHLQTNKVKYIAPFVAMIHSADSARLLEAIDAAAAKCGRTIDVLLEIHVAAEQTKNGWDMVELNDYLCSGAWRRLKHVRFRGVMGIATNTDDEGRIRADFETLAAYKMQIAPYFEADFDTLSMGMSSDWRIAVECGSTMVRIGSDIFGNRYYGPAANGKNNL